MGLGSNVPYLNKLAKCNLPLFINNVIACATSNNHTVIQTSDGYFVCGTNVGQMGEYAANYFQELLPSSSKIPQFTKVNFLFFHKHQ